MFDTICKNPAPTFKNDACWTLDTLCSIDSVMMKLRDLVQQMCIPSNFERTTQLSEG